MPAVSATAASEKPIIAVLIPEVTWKQVISPQAAATLENAGRLLRPDVKDEAQVRDALSRSSVALTGWKCPKITADLLEAAPSLKLIAHTAGSVKGLIDASAWERGVAVSHAANLIANAVAEMCIALELACLRRIHELDRGMRAGKTWDQLREWPGELLHGKKVGLVGCGYVARKHIHLLKAFGCEISVFDPYLSDAAAAELGVRRTDLDSIFRESKVVSNHAPITPETKGLVGKQQLAALQPGSVFINTARAYTVDYGALLDELRTGRFYAALDVFEKEPLAQDSPFFDLQNVILTPHAAGHSEDSHLAQGQAMAEEIQRFLAGEPLRYQVTKEQLAIMA
jgi:phosphoglycerate dehydrogenase-like enzyme